MELRDANVLMLSPDMGGEKVAHMIIALHDIKLASTKPTHLKQIMTSSQAWYLCTAGGGLKSVIPCHPLTTLGESFQRSNREHITVGFELWVFSCRNATNKRSSNQKW